MSRTELLKTANNALIVGAALEHVMWTSENSRRGWRDRAIVGLEKRAVLET